MLDNHKFLLFEIIKFCYYQIELNNNWLYYYSFAKIWTRTRLAYSCKANELTRYLHCQSLFPKIEQNNYLVSGVYLRPKHVLKLLELFKYCTGHMPILQAVNTADLNMSKICWNYSSLVKGIGLLVSSVSYTIHDMNHGSVCLCHCPLHKLACATVQWVLPTQI